MRFRRRARRRSGDKKPEEKSETPKKESTRRSGGDRVVGLRALGRWQVAGSVGARSADARREEAERCEGRCFLGESREAWHAALPGRAQGRWRNGWRTEAGGDCAGCAWSCVVAGCATGCLCSPKHRMIFRILVRRVRRGSWMRRHRISRRSWMLFPQRWAEAHGSTDGSTIVFSAATPEDAPPGYDELFALAVGDAAAKPVRLSAGFRRTAECVSTIFRAGRIGRLRRRPWERAPRWCGSEWTGRATPAPVEFGRCR